jgi:hypothetical protein
MTFVEDERHDQAVDRDAKGCPRRFDCHRPLQPHPWLRPQAQAQAQVQAQTRSAGNPHLTPAGTWLLADTTSKDVNE